MSVVIGLLGDIYVDRAGPDHQPFREVDLATGDFWFANLEAPITSAGPASRAKRSWTDNGFKMEPEVVDQLRGLSALSIANNHALDYGHDAYVETIAVLDGAGIGHAGGGPDRTSARAPWFGEKNGVKVALLAYTCVYQEGWQASDTRPGMATVKVHTTYEAPLRVFEQPGWPPIVHTFADPADRDVMQREILEARASADFVVVSFHWGLSMGERAVVDYQGALGRLAIDSGADAVFGHHPHTIQPVMFHVGKPIFLSLGNIVFDYDKAWRGDPATAAVRLYVDDGKLVRIGITPLVRDAGSNPTRPADEAVAHAIVDRILVGAGQKLAATWTGPECVLSLAG
jgi:poly-gamma-glutamate capsule biosynthesis protein CapA/YwtB (metallophosphatase superfamily)